MAAGDGNRQVVADERDLVQLRTAVTNMENRFEDLLREVRHAVALVAPAPQPNQRRGRAGGDVLPPPPMEPLPNQHRNEPLRRRGNNHRQNEPLYQQEGSSSEEEPMDETQEDFHRRGNHEYKLKMDIPVFSGKIDIEEVLD